jgi:hypothetical protein
VLERFGDTLGTKAPSLELAVQPRAIVGRREERPTVPEGLGANIAEVGLAEEAPR